MIQHRPWASLGKATVHMLPVIRSSIPSSLMTIKDWDTTSLCTVSDFGDNPRTNRTMPNLKTCGANNARHCIARCTMTFRHAINAPCTTKEMQISIRHCPNVPPSISSWRNKNNLWELGIMGKSSSMTVNDSMLDSVSYINFCKHGSFQGHVAGCTMTHSSALMNWRLHEDMLTGSDVFIFHDMMKLMIWFIRFYHLNHLALISSPKKSNRLSTHSDAYWYRPFLCIDTSTKPTAVPCPVRLVLQQISPGAKTDQSQEGTLAEWCLESHYLGKFKSFQKSTWCPLQFSIDLKKRTKEQGFFVVRHTVQSVRTQWSLMMFDATGSPELGEAASKVCSIDSACHRRWAWTWMS